VLGLSRFSGSSLIFNPPFRPDLSILGWRAVPSFPFQSEITSLLGSVKFFMTIVVAGRDVLGVQNDPSFLRGLAFFLFPSHVAAVLFPRLEN